jgi:IPT/TIG domain
MATFSAVRLVFGKIPAAPTVKSHKIAGRKFSYKPWIFLTGIVLFSSLAVAQNSPTVTGVDPALGKVNDTVTVNGSNVGKESVSAVYLSDDKNDYKTTIVEQSNDKITMKVPQVKAGSYNISLQVGDKLFIKPVKFKVEE